MRIESLLKKAAEKYTDAPALSEWNGLLWREISYASLFDKANLFCEALQKRDVKQGERIVLIAHNQITAFISLIGIWLARATAVLIDPDLPLSALEDQIMISDSRIVIIEKEKYAELENILYVDYCVLIDNISLAWQHKNNLRSTTVDQDCSEKIATLLFTSGTTGSYKAVMLTHDNYLYLNDCYQEYVSGFEKKCLMTVLPFFHVAGLFTSFLQPLFVGGNSVFFKYFSVEALQQAFLKYHPDVLVAVPRLLEVFDKKLQAIVREKGFFNRVFFKVILNVSYYSQRFFNVNRGSFLFKPLHEKLGGKLTKIFTGSAVLPAIIQKRFLAYGFELLCSYGLTETCGPITFSTSKTRFIAQNVGRCVDKKALWVDKNEEIIYRGPALMKGYFRDDASTKQAITNGYFHTRDLGRLDSAYNLKIIGRINELIVFSDGKKSMPVHIENQYKLVENIQEFCVFSAIVDNTTAAVLAFVPLENTDSSKTKQRLFQRASELKSPYRISDVMIVDQLPRSNTLKIKRYLLTEKYNDQKKEEKIANKSDIFDYTLSEIMACFCEVLPDKKNNMTKDITFAELGVDSFHAVQLTNALNKKFHLSLAPTVFWFAHTISDLYAHIGGKMSAETITVTHKKTHKVAIVAMECAFPGAATIDAYWENMLDGKDAIVDIPASRWNNSEYYDDYALAPGKTNSRHGGFIDLCENFPGELFGLKNRVIASMDPQQKILLLMVKKLFEKFPIDEKTKKKTGFYLGGGFPDYMLHLTRLFSPEKINPYSGIGMADFSSIARISYHFGLEGPAILIKTACSSSLVAVHQAVRALQTGDCDFAIAGGINLVLSPDISVSLTKGGFLSPDGRCKSFDATANGYVRSEGCGLLLLKNYDDAVRDGDNILSVIIGSAINQDGASNGITAPSGKAQARCYELALENAGISADQVQYVEAHGSGTQLGDAIEMQSLQFVYDKNRQSDLHVGAVKSMIGHCESAAGIAGLIKTICVLQHQKIPPNLHYHAPNPNISFLNSKIVLPDKITYFKNPCDYAAVSSFGVAGTNAHMILTRC
ncbi:MAG: beta-ketoacyl synthase N-terminal-like domain-containing protein [Coxiellaceae bacterium]|nr:beta-ketoacyl synthase N-terminal-like domain-containing protein [Coxiellaceae bacterium]